MKYAFVLLILVILLGVTGAQDTAIEADQTYLRGDYTTAIQLYEQQLLSPDAPLNVLYNLGNAYYATGNLSKALLNYRRAQSHAPRDYDIMKAIALVRAEIGSNQSTPDLIETISTLTNPFVTFQELSWVVWALWLLEISLIAVVILITRRETLKYLIAVVGIACAFGLTLLVSRYVYETTQPLAIIMTDQTIAYSGNDKSYLPLFTLDSATEVHITTTDNDWVRVTTLDGKQGWVTKTNLERVNPN